MLEIDSLGFDPVERRYLQVLHDHHGSMRLNVIATQLGFPKQSIEMIEADFIRLGLVTKDEKGRSLDVLKSEASWSHISSMQTRCGGSSSFVQIRA
jgi:Holliday junction resolvasome RuvABC ATP-dependent DNA helicase subunit